MDPLFTPANSWCTARADRAAVLVDGDAYYSALYAALQKAQREVLLLGWDIDSRLCLRRDLDEAGRHDATLGVLFQNLAKRGIDCHLLTWDFVPIYAFEREPLTAAALDWTTHRRLRFELDGVHPHGASHHQKVVVIDDAVAFCGGIDLCGARWDTPAHTLDDPRRVDPPHAPHAPFHDVQMVVEGPIAARLGTLARERWRRATGEKLTPRGAPRRFAWKQPTPSATPWPDHVVAEFTGVDVAVARTEPPVEGRAEIREVEQLYVDLIAAAKDTIYFENQYLTSRVVSEALQQRLSEANGPEVAILVPTVCSGWMEENTMGARRSAFLRALDAADAFDRCIVVAPRVSAAPGTPRLNVHGKVGIVDDRWLRVGSANLSNRSMGLDTECDLAIDARGDAVVERGVRGVRARLLGEHLDEAADVVDASLRERGLKGTIEHFAQPDKKQRTVVVVEPTDPTIPQALIPLTVLADPEAPAAMDPLLGRGPGVGPARQRIRAALAVVFAVVFCFGLAALWRFTPLAALIAPERLQALLQPIVQGPQGPFVGVATFVVGGCLFFPLTLLVLQSGLLFHPVVAVGVSLVGAGCSAALSWLIGRAVGARTLARVIGREQLRAVANLDGRGVWAVAALRLAPVAPFTLVNLAAGAAGVRFSTFLLGTLIGMLPGIVALTLVGQGLLSVLKSVGQGSFEFVVVAVVGGAIATFLARALVRRRRAKKASGLDRSDDDGGDLKSAVPQAG